MKTCATVFSWLGGAIGSIAGLINIIQTAQSETPYLPAISLWIIWGISLVVRIAVLIWRQISVNNGKKVACGVCTLLFASLIGGILTLCIPQDQLDK